MPYAKTLHRIFAALVVFSFWMTGAARARETCVQGACMIDRVATGDIVLPDATFGLGVIDFDNDGWQDLVLGQRAGQVNRLLRNVEHPDRAGARAFEDVTIGSGLDDEEGLARGAFGFAIADYDDDGYRDIYTLGATSEPLTHGLLYHNNGDGTFTNVTVQAGLRGQGYAPESASWSDFDLDGDVDLLVANGEGSARSILLYRNEGNGAFSDASHLTPDLDPFGAVYCTLWSDYDRDGYADCFVLVFGNTPTLLKNVDDGQGGRRFENVAEPVGFTGLGFAPMGLTAGDVDGDDDVDYFASNGARGRYYINHDGVLESARPFQSIFGWGNALFDVENDGDLDYYMASSFPNPAADKLFLNQGDGRWEDASDALNGVVAASRFAVQVDYNDDGRVDLVAMNPNTPEQLLSVYENISDAGRHWLKIHLRGDGKRVNADAIGAVVRVTVAGVTRVREIYAGSSTASTEDLRAHFGLGAADAVDRIEVTWPHQGSVESRTRVYDGPFAADRIMRITFEEDEIDCDAIRGLKARCKPNRELIKAAARTELPEGTEIGFELNAERAAWGTVQGDDKARVRFREVQSERNQVTVIGCEERSTSADCRS